MRDAGHDLGDSTAVQQASCPLPRRCELVQPGETTAPVAAGRIDVGDLVIGDRCLEGVAGFDASVDTEGRQVRACDGRAQRVDLDAAHGEPGPGEGDEIGTDPAAEVHHGPGAPVTQLLGPMACHRRTRRLLQRVGRVVEAGRIGSQLRDGLLTEPLLGDGRGDELPRVIATQPSAQREVGHVRWLLGHRGE